MSRPTPNHHGWEGERYAQASEHHRDVDDWFLEQHPPRPDDHVIDAGAGSGEFTATLADLVPHGSVVGVEPDPSMLEAARRHQAPNLEFRQARVQELDRVCIPAAADLVVSRAVFHWIPLADYRTCYEAVRRVLAPGGWFHAESAGAGNLGQLIAVLDEVAADLGLGPAQVTMPDAGVVHELLEQAGFEIPRSGVATVSQRRSFERDALVAFVRTQAALAYGLGHTGRSGPGDDLPERFVAGVADRLEELRRHDGTYDQTFVRLHVLCRRPD